MMCAKLYKGSGPKRILLVSLTNIGDVVLTCPVIDVLRRDFPDARLDLVIGPKAVSLFADHPGIGLKVFDKKASFAKKVEWFRDLFFANYDCVIDLRNTMLPLFLAPKSATPFVLTKGTSVHKKDVHLDRLRQVYLFKEASSKRTAIITTAEDELFFKEKLSAQLNGKPLVVIAPGAADSAKRWHSKGFAAIADHLSGTHQVLLVGDGHDVKIVDEIRALMRSQALSLAGQINLRQLAYVLQQCSWAITHDSGVMHLASYFNVPLIVLWGPTDIKKYAPWSQKNVIIRRNEKCLRCLDPKHDEAHNCMSFIEVEDLINAIKKIES